MLMSESYIECMVAARTPMWKLVCKYLMYFLTVVAVLLFFVTGGAGVINLAVMVVAIALGVGAYFMSLFSNLEYEYLYLDKEITVDKILNKSRRKRMATYSLEKIEIMAPIRSYHLDGYKNRTCKVVDISSGVENMPDKRYVFFYDGKEKIIFEPTEEFVKIVKNVAPRKVFTD